uniref:Uncharacterized protein n=1 Tax=Klebsiella pneumoniae TaxID=573 RepID=A0A8B0SX58_KLEPN|nr:hypothetical protein [Klebsiella pneumoniae]
MNTGKNQVIYGQLIFSDQTATERMGTRATQSSRRERTENNNTHKMYLFLLRSQGEVKPEQK